MPKGREILTVEELWKLTMPSETRLLGGRSGIDRQVEWVTSLRATFPLFGRLERGYLALADLALARRVEPGIAVTQLLRELARVEAAGLVIDERPSQKAVSVADDLHLPLFSLSKSVDLSTLERDMLHALLDREGHLARRREAIRREMRRLFSHGGLEALLHQLSEIVSAEVRIRSAGERAHGEADASLKPMAALPIRVAGRRLGQLELAQPVEELSEVQRIYAEEVAELCGIEMLERQTRHSARQASAQELLDTLVQGGEAARMELTRMGYEFDAGRRHVVLAFESSGPEDLASGPSPAQELRWLTQHTAIGMLVMPLQMHELAICSLPPDLPMRRLEEWLAQACEQTQRRRGSCPTGVSRPVQEIEQIPAAVEQACAACRLGQRIRGAAPPYHYAELGLYRLLGQLSDRGEVKRFQQELLGQLVAYDEEHGTELLITLEAYFNHHGNISETAEALYVHRNTLSYRLQRVTEITGLQLSDPEARLNLQVALKIHRLEK